jgi:hypothetical protein
LIGRKTIFERVEVGPSVGDRRVRGDASWTGSQMGRLSGFLGGTSCIHFAFTLGHYFIDSVFADSSDGRIRSCRLGGKVKRPGGGS